MSVLADRAFAEMKSRGGQDAMRESLSRIERLMDEVDGCGGSDRGGLAELSKIIK